MKKKNKNVHKKRQKVDYFKSFSKTFFGILDVFLKFSKILVKICSQKWFLPLFFLFLTLIFTLSSFNLAGKFGAFVLKITFFLFGKAHYFLGPLCFLVLFTILFSKYKKKEIFILLNFFLFLFGISWFFGEGFFGGKIDKGAVFLFGPILSKIFSLSFVLLSLFLFFLFSKGKKENSQPSYFKRFLIPIFKEKEIPAIKKVEIKTKEKVSKEEFPEKEYARPPLEIFEAEKDESVAGDIERNVYLIKKTMEDFGIEVEMGQVKIGPTVTQYTLKPAEGVKVSKITSLVHELSLALASHPIRIEAPIPGKSLVGIEIPNQKRALVRLKNLLSLKEFQNSSPLIFAAGRDVVGEPVLADLSKMPHLLVAGATGTGKTLLLNSLILSLVYKNPPEILKLILVDPKRVEFSIYQNLPHLLCPVILDTKKVVLILNWLISEMERRFETLALKQKRNIFEYQLSRKDDEEEIPFIVLIIDELADLMLSRGKEIENKIVRLTQLGRAVGIHLVLATQRPSVEVLTGLIKANITSRIALKVATQFDSRTILDMGGAEKLLGRGDALFLMPGTTKPKRIQTPFISETELKKVMQWFEKKGMLPNFNNEVLEVLESDFEERDTEEIIVEDDPLLEEAEKLVIQTRKASASFLQRKMRIGYARAARLLDLLEKKGVVGPAQGSKPREVLIGQEEKEDEEENKWESI
jgi:S-DNA-T family DNA segregation ATPase FtsK/SpoIIIE